VGWILAVCCCYCAHDIMPQSSKFFTDSSISSVSLWSFVHSCQSVTSGLRCPFLLSCAVGHVVAFAVNAALVANQWQHRAWTFPCTQPFSAEHEAAQAASTVFQVFDRTRSGIEPNLPDSAARAQPTITLHRQRLNHVMGNFEVKSRNLKHVGFNW